MIDFGKRKNVFILICFMYFPQSVVPYYQYPSVYWAPKNCRFNLNKPPNSAYEFFVKPFGKLYFVCPNIALWNDMSSTGPQLSMMYENLVLVDKTGYDTCTVNKTGDPLLNRVILKCDGDASKLKYMQETFSRHRADQDRMKYYPGKTYYFISTSNGSKESLDNLSGGHCKTLNMKLKITVCKPEDSCVFHMPKCPFTKVFNQRTTATSTLAPTTNATLPPQNIDTEATTESTEPTSNTVKATEENKIRNEIPFLSTKPPTKPIAAKLSADDAIWGSPRKHIIIHITMALVILVLMLSLIYVLVTRRNPKSKPTASFSSKLYQERPTSAIPLNGDLTEDVRTV